MKTGRMSRAEWNFIDENADKLTPEKIAEKLDRDIDPVLKYLKKIGKAGDKIQSLKVQAEYDIKSRDYWKELKLQFTDHELDLFLYHWKQIIAQFRKDVLHTEEQQIVDFIKLELLMNRTLKEKQEAIQRVAGLQALLDEELARDPDQQDRDLVMSLDRQITSLITAKESLSREFKDLYDKKSRAYKELKATREQRIQKLEGDKSTMAGLIEKLLRDPTFFEECGKEMEKMRLAMENSKKELGDYHEYLDGTIDRPLLTPDTVRNEDEG